MKSVLIGKVETDPLMHYGGVFNTFEWMILSSFFSFLVFIPFVKDQKIRNFLFYTTALMPLLNMYYRNNHPFVGGVFLGHLLFIIGIFLIATLAFIGFEKVEIKGGILLNKRLIVLMLIVLFLIRAILVFGSRPTDSGIFSGAGALIYASGSSMFRDYFGVVSIGSRYGPMLYLAYLPFVPIAYITKYFLWGDALTHWNSISDVPLTVATSCTGALFYEGLILFLLIKSFKRFGYYAALFYMLNPLNSLILSVNANELPQTALFILGIYLLKRPIISSISFVLSSLMKIYPLVIAPFFSFALDKSKRRNFLLSIFFFFAIGFFYWLYEASHAPPELKTNPLRDILLYQKDPGSYHSLWYFIDMIVGKTFTYILFVLMISMLLYYAAMIILKEKNYQFLSQRMAILLLSIIIILNQSPHPGYYYFILNLLTYLFFSFQEDCNNPSVNENFNCK